jgi:NAD(P)-dependent dehydrogenase (short-subunit alcohol dehydrogenase family)
MLATNVRGMFFSMKHELAVMAKQGFGSIVNISSGAGLTGVPATPATSPPSTPRSA